MSWITDLADKAENMLNKIDKNAATALQLADAQEVIVNKTTANNVQNGEVTIDLSASSHEAAIMQPASNISPRKQKTSAMSLPSSPSRTKLAFDEQELSAFKIALNELTRERNDLLEQLNTLKNDEEFKEKLKQEEQLQASIDVLTRERDATQLELTNLRTDSESQIALISQLETNYVKLQQEYRGIADKLDMQLQENARNHQEFDEYRIKAQRALHAKDVVIEELKHCGTAKDADTVGILEQQTPVVRDTLREQYEQLMKQNLELNEKLDEIQHTKELRQGEHDKELKSLRSALTTERELAIAMASDQRVLSQEVNSLRQQLNNLKVLHAARLQEKDEELQRALVVQRNDTPIQHDERLKTLTGVLVDKQNALERITAERNALRLQLEKVENQLRKNNVLDIPLDTTRNSLFSNSTDDVKSQFPMLLKENPFDTRVTRRVKRGFSSLDSVGVRLGTFLRRYPLMRGFVLMYVGLLHIWVMFVLLSSTPN